MQQVLEAGPERATACALAPCKVGTAATTSLSRSSSESVASAGTSGAWEPAPAEYATVRMLFEPFEPEMFERCISLVGREVVEQWFEPIEPTDTAHEQRGE